MKFPPAATKASRSSKDWDLSVLPMKCDHEFPIDIAPRWGGETRMLELGERIRSRPNSVVGSGAGAMISAIVVGDAFSIKKYDMCS